MTPTLFPLKQRIISNKVLLKQDLVAANNMAPSVLLAGLQDYSSNFEITYQDFSPVSISNATQVKAVADQMDDAVFKNRLNDTYFPTDSVRSIMLRQITPLRFLRLLFL